jgi:hypothetical protein
MSIYNDLFVFFSLEKQVLDYSKFENNTGQEVQLNLEPFHISSG